MKFVGDDGNSSSRDEHHQNREANNRPELAAEFAERKRDGASIQKRWNEDEEQHVRIERDSG